MDKNIKSINKLRIFHLLPSEDLGGAEIASKTCNFIDNKNFIFRTHYINRNKFSKNYFLKVINEFKNNLKSFLYFLKTKNFILICSLWKSSFLSILLKIFLPKTKVILFLHSSKSAHFFDRLFTSFVLIFAHEVWSDSKMTLIKRFDDLFVKRKSINTKILSFMIRKLDPLVVREKISFNFIYWGRLHKVKNLKQTIKFFKQFYDLDNTSKLTLIGHDYGMKIELKNLIQNLGLNNNVEILEFMDISKIANYASYCSFFIQLSHYEGMAMSVVEAMQFGLVPIVTNVGEIEHYCIDYQNSIIYEGLQKTFNKVFELKKSEIDFQEISNNAINTWKNKKLYKEDIFYNCKLISQAENLSI